ncbi:MAG: hypothetical protein R3F46_03425 [bacterium]
MSGKLAASRNKFNGAGFLKTENKDQVDTAPIVITEFTGPAGNLLIVSPPLKILPVHLADDGILLAEYEPLGIAVGAASREELVLEVREYLENLWVAYVVEPADKLTTGAVQLRNSLLELVRQ